MPDPLATPPELAQYLRTASQADADAGSPDVLDTAAATQALASASGSVRGECHWNISEETVTRTVNRSRCPLLLPTLRLTSVTATVDGTPLTLGVDFTFEENGIVTLAAGRYWVTPAVELTYTHGYDPVPDDVKLVTLERAAQIYENPTRKVSQSIAGTTDVYARLNDNGPSLGDSRLWPYYLQAIG